MAHVDPRLRDVPPEIQARARALLDQYGQRRAAEELGIGRAALLSIVAVGRCMPGTLAIIREHERGGLVPGGGFSGGPIL